MKKQVWRNKSVLQLVCNDENIDPIEEIRRLTRQMVLEAFEKGWDGPPFDPFKLARIHNIRVVPNETITDARILSVSDIDQIEYNPYQKTTRINFSVSHEIGHFLFPDFRDKTRNREEERAGDLWELEFLCDIAASEILLPYAEFASEANSVPLTMQSLIHISNKYQASLGAVFLRFTQVVNKPCGILIASFAAEDQNGLVVDYFKPSSALDLEVSNGAFLPKFSKAYECVNAGWTAEGQETWDILQNVEYSFYFIGMPPIKGQKRKRVAAFIVPLSTSDISQPSIYTVNGDATQPRGNGNKVIVQVVNTAAATGIGFGKSMAVKWPDSKKALLKWKAEDDFKLGGFKLTQLSESIYVFQIVAQKGIRPKNGGESIFSYIALQKALGELRDHCFTLNASVHMPMVGAGQARGDWNIIQGIIYDELVCHEIDVTVYVLPGTQFNPKNLSPLTLFETKSIYETP